MSFWNKDGGRGVIASINTAAERVQEVRANAGEYQLLYKYLRDRFANRLVLTFADIEDLVGFPLPDAARVQESWWASEGTVACRSWTLANRTATVNLSAQIVVFERQTLPHARPGSH